MLFGTVRTSMAGSDSAAPAATGGRRGASIAQELLLYACSAAISCLVIVISFRQLDPNRAQAKLAAARKKEIARRLGRPYISTNSYEVRSDVYIP